MPIFNFESKAERQRRRIHEFGTRIGQEAAKSPNYDSESDPVIMELFKKFGTTRPRTPVIPQERNKIIFDPKKDFRLQDFKRRLRDIWK